MSQNKRSMAPSARTFFFDLVASIIDAACNIVFLLIQLELRQYPTNLAYISSRLLGSVPFQFIWKFLRRWCDLLQRNSHTVAQSDAVDRKIMSRSSCQFS